MRILLIEDDFGKEKMIGTFIDESFPQHNLTVCRSILTGRVELRKACYDCVLLDMTLPLFDSDDSRNGDVGNYRIEPFGGKIILGEIDRLGLQCKVIVITAYDVIGEGESRRDLDSLTDELRSDYPRIIEESIFYNASSKEWRNKLAASLQKLGSSA